MSESFAKVPLGLLTDARIHPHDLAVYAAIYTHCDFQTLTGSPAIAEITARCPIKRQSVVTAIRHLQDLGWMTRQHQSGKETVYVLQTTPLHAAPAVRVRNRPRLPRKPSVAVTQVTVAPDPRLPRKPTTDETQVTVAPAPKIRREKIRASSDIPPADAGGELFSRLYAWWPQNTDCWPQTKQGVIAQQGAIKRLVKEALARAGPDGAERQLAAWVKAFQRLRAEKKTLPGKQPFLPTGIGTDGMWPYFLDAVNSNGHREISEQAAQEAMNLWKRR